MLDFRASAGSGFRAPSLEALHKPPGHFGIPHNRDPPFSNQTFTGEGPVGYDPTYANPIGRVLLHASGSAIIKRESPSPGGRQKRRTG